MRFLICFKTTRNTDTVFSSYVPGWDCHGLPIENKALQELGVRAICSPPCSFLKFAKKDSSIVSPSIIREAAHAVAIREIASQKEQFRNFGIMANWGSNESTYRTLDHSYEIRQLRIFEKIVNKGWSIGYRVS